MSNITPPQYVKKILIGLQSRGHLAYLVGGCVRDMLLGVRPQDWDICTSALPEQVIEIFPLSRPTGFKHGTVTVVMGSKSVEVTTFRCEGAYEDHRHPDAVSFVGDLTTDLSRRDFTMNAIALPVDGLIADPFNGVEDIENHIIRCVGLPMLRFEEDALRMFRALRFSARLGFEIEPETLKALKIRAPLAASLAPERVKTEVEKLLLTKAPEKIYELISYGLMDRYLICRMSSEGRLRRMAGLPRKALPRWAALCMILEKQGCISSPETFLTSLHLDSRTIRCCVDACYLILRPKPADVPQWKRLLRDYGVDTVGCAAVCADCLYGGHCKNELKAILKSGECFSMKHLAVSGDDLLSIGLKGRELGVMLRFLLDYVIDYPENNRRELLLQLAANTEEQ